MTAQRRRLSAVNDTTAVEQLDRVISGVVVTARTLASVQTLYATVSVRRNVRRRAPLYGSVAVLAAESAWALARLRRRGTTRDHVVAWVDVIAADLALLGEAASWGTRRFPPDPRWSQVYGLLTAAWTSFGNGDPTQAAFAAASWVATYAGATSSRALDRGGASVSGQRLSEMAGGAVFYGVGVSLGQGLRAQSEELDDARSHAIAEAEREAAETERINQFRLLHDSVLQVLETVAGSWHVDAELLLRRIDFEIERLERVLGGGALAPEGSLHDALRALRVEFALIGVNVELDLPDTECRCSRTSIEALNDAAHEALMNVHKHAEVRCAFASVVCEDTTVVVTIRDHGRGFDTARPRSGFGVEESIQRRLAGLGGSALIESFPGDGTTVVLRLPR